MDFSFVLVFVVHFTSLTLLFQATMPSTFKHPAHVPMWKGAKVAYFFIAMCLFPMAIGGYWAYGNLVSVLDPICLTTLCINDGYSNLTKHMSLCIFLNGKQPCSL